MTAAQVAQLRSLYAPGSRELAESLPAIASGMSDSLFLLGARPTLAAVSQAQAQARGLEQYLAKLREAIVREGGE